MWTQDVVKLVTEKFVALAVDGRVEMARKDSPAEFLRSAQALVITANGRASCITASGKSLGDMALRAVGNLPLTSLQKALKAWEALPESERAPGAVKVGEPESVDPERVLESPPSGALVFQVSTRRLGRDSSGKPRYTVPEDYEPEARKSAARYAEPANDTLWVPEAEWKEFLRPNPKKGDRFPVPTSFALRLFRYHLDPMRGIGEGMSFAGATPESGSLIVEVEEATPDLVRMRLAGSAELRQSRGKEEPLCYSPSLLGFVECDPKKGAITRFDLVALGDVKGNPGPRYGAMIGVRPLGVAFELARDPSPAERLLPRGARGAVKAYLAGGVNGR